MSPPATSHSPSAPDACSPEDTALALDLLSSEASHELVHALNYLRFLVRSNKGSGVSAELIDYAGPEIERLELLLHHLYSFKLPALTLKKVSLSELLEQSLSPLRDSCAQAQVELCTEVTDALSAYVDEAALSSALRYLLKHALTNAPQGSRIKVYAATDASSHGGLLIEVADSGPPLDDPSPAAMFNVWGIGAIETQLSRRVFAQRLIRNLGGTLTFESVSGCNVFRVTLPTAPSEHR